MSKPAKGLEEGLVQLWAAVCVGAPDEKGGCQKRTLALSMSTFWALCRPYYCRIPLPHRAQYHKGSSTSWFPVPHESQYHRFRIPISYGSHSVPYGSQYLVGPSILWVLVPPRCLYFMDLNTSWVSVPHGSQYLTGLSTLWVPAPHRSQYLVGPSTSWVSVPCGSQYLTSASCP